MLDLELERRVAERLGSLGIEFEPKRMFGGVCFLVDGKMCLGIVDDSLMVRFDPERSEELLSRPGARMMDFTKRPMKGYAFVGPEGHRDNAWLSKWIDLALEFNPRARSSKKEKRRNG